MKSLVEIIQKRPWVGWVLFLGTIVIVFLVAILASSVVERRTESRLAREAFAPLPEFEPRNAVWGEQFPREYAF